MLKNDKISLSVFYSFDSLVFVYFILTTSAYVLLVSFDVASLMDTFPVFSIDTCNAIVGRIETKKNFFI